MKITDMLTTAVGNTLRSKTRTTLTVLAIFIGAFTLTITSAIGTGVSDYIDNQIGAFGAKDVLTITKASEETAQQEGPAEYDPDAGDRRRRPHPVRDRTPYRGAIWTPSGGSTAFSM